MFLRVVRQQCNKARCRMFEQHQAKPSLKMPDDVRSVAFLVSPDHQRLALLQRADWKTFAPGRWTGIGGKLEGEEIAEPALGALRELREETGLKPDDLNDWRFVADIIDPGAEVRLVYYVAVFAGEQLPPCTEGTLHWVPLTEYQCYDLIENTRAVLDALVARGLLPPAPAFGTERLPLRGMIRRDAPGGNVHLELFQQE
jgi:8-oxo-dGTP diphosphatase